MFTGFYLSVEMILLSTAYFAPVRYYSELLPENSTVIIERHEHYNKQSYRNRCTIYSANGLLDLVVPIAKAMQAKVLITKVEISYDTKWQKQHFKAIESAYRRSPFYEYYIDDLMVFFKEQYQYLYDFNMQIMCVMCRLMTIPFRVRESCEYVKVCAGITDLRDGIHPKETRIIDPNYIFPRYAQVFDNKFGFKPNLSILDLLFNMGPEANNILSLTTKSDIDHQTLKIM